MIAVVLLIMLFVCCWYWVAHFFDKNTREEPVTQPIVEPIIEPEIARIDLLTVEPRSEECSTVYDFDIEVDSGALYCLAALYEEELYLLVDSPRGVSDVSWQGTTTTAIDSPPAELEMKIEGGNGQQTWYQIPREATEGGEIVITLK